MSGCIGLVYFLPSGTCNKLEMKPQLRVAVEKKSMEGVAFNQKLGRAPKSSLATFCRTAAAAAKTMENQ